jgi:ubiquinone/menaquinone biosynthesis C-methylase UbiE
MKMLGSELHIIFEGCLLQSVLMGIESENYSRKESKAFYEEFYSNNDFKSHNKADAALISVLRQRYAISPEASILDVPCGTGKFSQHWRGQGHDVLGVDISKQGVETARETCPDCEFAVGDALNLPASDESFDVVFCHGFSLFNTTKFEETRPFMQQAMDKLRPGGLFIWGKTSAMRDGSNKRESRIDFTRNRIVSFFKSIENTTYIETRSTIPHILPILGTRSFTIPISRSLQYASKISKLPIRNYVVLEK